jgi:hypothetical protein
MSEVEERKLLLARNGMQLTVKKNETVWAYSGSTIIAEKGSIYYAFGGSMVFAYAGSTGYGYADSEIWACGSIVRDPDLGTLTVDAAKVYVAEQVAHVEGGEFSELYLWGGIRALVKAKANVHREHAGILSVEPGWAERVLNVICNERATIFGGTGNTLYIERGAVYL